MFDDLERPVKLESRISVAKITYCVFLVLPIWIMTYGIVYHEQFRGLRNLGILLVFMIMVPMSLILTIVGAISWRRAKSRETSSKFWAVVTMIAFLPLLITIIVVVTS